MVLFFPFSVKSFPNTIKRTDLMAGFTSLARSLTYCIDKGINTRWVGYGRRKLITFAITSSKVSLLFTTAKKLELNWESNPLIG